MLTVKETAERLGLSEQRVRDLIGRGYLPAKKFGDVWALEEKDVERFAKLPSGKAGKPRRL